MILTDTGPLIGIVDPADSYHIRSREVVESLAGEVLLTTWPCFTEAMYFLGESGGISLSGGSLGQSSQWATPDTYPD